MQIPLDKTNIQPHCMEGTRKIAGLSKVLHKETISEIHTQSAIIQAPHL